MQALGYVPTGLALWYLWSTELQPDALFNAIESMLQTQMAATKWTRGEVLPNGMVANCPPWPQELCAANVSTSESTNLSLFPSQCANS